MTNLQLAEWLQANAFWLGYPAMALLGGAISHILAFEKVTVKWTIGQHCGLLTIAWTKAFFIATLIFYIGQEYKLSPPLCFVFTGLFSVFATDFITWIYAKVKRVLGVRLDPTDKGD